MSVSVNVFLSIQIGIERHTNILKYFYKRYGRKGMHMSCFQVFVKFLKKHLVQKHARPGSIDYTNSRFLRVCKSDAGRSLMLFTEWNIDLVGSFELLNT